MTPRTYAAEPLAWKGEGGCLIDGCQRRPEIRGMCKSHYDRERGAGRLPLISELPRQPLPLTDPPRAIVCAQGVDRAYLAISLERPGDMAIVLTRAVGK